MLLWTHLFGFTKLVAGDLANSPVDLEDVMGSPIPGRWHFWFLWALLLMHLGLPVLRPWLCSPRFQPPALWLLLAASLALQAAPVAPEVHVWTSNALRYLPYLALGLLMAEVGAGVLRAERLGPLWLAVFAVTLAAVPWLADRGMPAIPTAALLSLSAVATMIWLAKRPSLARQLLARLGAFSMIIFLSHTIFSAALREALLAAGVQGILLHMLLGTLAGLVLPVLLQQAFARIASPRLIGA